MNDICKAWLANGTIIGVVTITQAESFLKLILLVLTIIYTAKKIWFEKKDTNDE